MNERVEELVVPLDRKSEDSLKKKFLGCWKIYTTHKLNRKRAIHKALYSYNVRLKQKVLNSLLRTCIEAKKTRSFYKCLCIIEAEQFAGYEKARDFERRKVLKRVCQVWHNYTNEQRRKNAFNSWLFHLRYKVFIRKYINDWKEILLEKKRIIELDDKATEFYSRSTILRFFRLWLDNHNSGVLEKTYWANAIMHCDRKMLKKHFYPWIKYWKIKIKRRHRIIEMKEFYVKKLLTRSLKMLLRNSGRAIAKRRKIEEATIFYVKKLERRIFCTWTNYCRRKRKFRNKVKARREKIDNSLKVNTLNQWRFYVWHKKCLRRKNQLSLHHYNRKLIEKSLRSLKNYLLYKLTKEMRLVYLKSGITEITLDILNVHIDKWRVAVVRVSQERQKIQYAQDHWRFHLIKLYFRAWKEFSKNHKLKAERNGILNEIGKTVLLERYMNLWMKNYETFATIRSKEIEAASVYERKIKLRLFRSWKKYVNDKLLRKMEIEEAQKIHRKLLLREGLKETLKNCLYAAESRYENRLSCLKKNCIDDFDTMKKFFVRWLSFAWANNNRKDRKSTILRKQNENTLELPLNPISTRLVLPEYMLKKTRLYDTENDFFHAGSFSHSRL